MRLRRATMLVVLVGFGASFGGFFAASFPWISLLGGLLGTLVAAGLLGLAVGLRDETLGLAAELEAKSTEVDEVLTRQAQIAQGLRQAQRLEAVTQLAGGIAHDFNNLLQTILSYSEFLSDGLDPESEMQQDVAEVQKAAHRAAGLTHQLLIFSRQNVTAPSVVDLNNAAGDAEHLLRSTLDADTHLRLHAATAPCPVLADRGELELILVNLATNARDAMPCGGNIRVTIDTTELDDEHARALGVLPGSFARIEVADDGEGMTPEVATKAFQPFFTTKETGRGAGLGLSMVHGIAKRSGGVATLATDKGLGTTVTVLFPLSRHAPPAYAGPDVAHSEEETSSVHAGTVPVFP